MSSYPLHLRKQFVMDVLKVQWVNLLLLMERKKQTRYKNIKIGMIKHKNKRKQGLKQKKQNERTVFKKCSYGQTTQTAKSHWHRHVERMLLLQKQRIGRLTVKSNIRKNLMTIRLRLQNLKRIH